MAMTSSVKDELCRLTTQLDPTAPEPDRPRPLKVSERKAEVASLLRFAGGLHIVGGRAIVEADLDTGAVARRLRAEIADLYNQNADVQVLAPTGSRKNTRYVVRVIHGGDTLARQTGLIDQRGRPVRGLPPQVVAGSVTDAIGAWRGAFLAQGSLTDPGRSASLEVICPGPEAALALVGAARRMGVVAKAREVRGADRVVVRDGDAIALMLRLLGAARTLAGWEERRQRRESVQTSTNRLANFDDANLRRSARAAVAASARVSRALEILGPTAPGHLIQAGELRIAHGHASLEELGQLAEPPMTKDAVAGRIRRLLTMADKRAQELDIPDTESVVTPEMLEG